MVMLRRALSRLVDAFARLRWFQGAWPATGPEDPAGARLGAPATGEHGSEHRGMAAARLMMVVLCLLAFVRTAWVSDDAFITFRAVDNVVRGHGLVSNPGERVQGFTNPLWALLMVPVRAVTGEVYFSGIAFSLLLSTAAVALLLRRVPRTGADLVFLALPLAFSRAFTDYSTSGLENALSHFLLVVLLLEYFEGGKTPRSALVIFFLAALLMVNRLDNALLVAPLVVHQAVVSRGPKLARLLALGFLPLVLWELFSVVYYGFPFPNTAYAKLNSAFNKWVLPMQGVGYLLDSVARDPMTLLVVAAGGAGAVVSRQPRALVPMLGVALYVAYIVKVGGDFMSGRFLTTCFVAAVAVVGRWVLPALPSRWTLGGVGVLVLVVISAPSNPLRPASEVCSAVNGITDERSCYYPQTGLLNSLHKTAAGWGYQTHDNWVLGLQKRGAPERVLAFPIIGLGGYAVGPRVHFVDQAALTDALLARIPYRPEGEAVWRIGHFYRQIPEGYVETLRERRNLIKNPCVRAFYEKLALATRAPLLARGRLEAIFGLNFGRYSYLLSPRCSAPLPEHQGT